jgi:hypothetical protein
METLFVNSLNTLSNQLKNRSFTGYTVEWRILEGDIIEHVNGAVFKIESLLPVDLREREPVTTVTGYAILYNPVWGKFQVAHPEIGFCGRFNISEDAIEYCENG